MAEKNTIDIELIYQDRKMDMRVPNKVTLNRLKLLLVENMRLTLPQHWELTINNKYLTIADDIPLANYPIADGDQFVISSLEDK